MRNFSFYFITFLFLLLPLSASASIIAKPTNNLGLVGYWPMSEGSGTVVGDFSGNHLSGTLSGSIPPSWVAGKFGTALGSHVFGDTVMSGTANLLKSASAFTLSEWVYSNATPSADTRFIAGKFEGGTTGWGIETSVASFGSTDDFLAFVENGGVDAYGITTTHALQTGKWIFVTEVFDGTQSGDSNRLKLYVNGIQQTLNFTHAPGIPATTDTSTFLFSLGDWDNGNGGGAVFDGNIDDVRLYNRAISATEVANLYQYGASRAGVSTASLIKSNSTLASGLVGSWTFDGPDITDKVYDRSGQNNNGYILNSATSTMETLGKLGQALNFDGVDDRVTLTNSLNLGTVNSLSVWVYWQGNNDSVVVGGPDGNYMLFLDGTNAYYSAGAGNFVQAAHGGIPVGQWTHFAVTRNGATVNIYKNGVALTPVNSNFGTPGASVTIDTIGSYETGAPTMHQTRGKIDDVRIYNRELSASEVLQLYNFGATKFNTAASNFTTGSTLTNGLVGYWTFDGSAVNWTTGIVADSSGSGNNGTIVAMSTTSSPAAGKLGQALNFNGSNSYVGISAGVPLPGDATICAWVNARSLGNRAIVDREDVTAHEYELYSFASGKIGIGWDTNLAKFRETTNVVLTTGVWYHVCATRTSDGLTAHIYINGSEPALDPITGGTIPTMGVAGTYIGDELPSGCGATCVWDGKLDDVRLYNRILNASEAKQLYNLGK